MSNLKMTPDSVFFTEERFIAYLLTHPHMIRDKCENIAVDDFFSIQSRIIYMAIQTMELSGAEVNTHSTVSFLNAKKDKKGVSQLDNIGGTDTIAAIVSQPFVSDEEADILVESITSESKKRKITEVLSWAGSNMSLDPEELIVNVEKKLEVINNAGQATSELLGGAYDELEKRFEIYADPEGKVVGIQSGFLHLDGILDGFKPGETYCFYAPSSRYKSAFTSNLGWRFARQGVAGLWIPSEMTQAELLERVAQLQSEQNFRYLRADGYFAYHRESIEKKAQEVRDMPIYISKSQDRDVNSIVRQIRKEKKWHDVQYVIIDLLDHVYSHLFQENEVSNQSEVVRKLTLAAKDTGVALILVSHITKEEKELRGRHIIPVESLKGSSSKYQDVEVAISIMPSYRHQDDDGVKRWKGMSVTDISYRQQKRKLIPLYVSIQKNRNGMLGDVVFEVDPIKGNVINEIGIP